MGYSYWNWLSWDLGHSRGTCWMCYPTFWSCCTGFFALSTSCRLFCSTNLMLLICQLWRHFCPFQAEVSPQSTSFSSKGWPPLAAKLHQLKFHQPCSSKQSSSERFHCHHQTCTGFLLLKGHRELLLLSLIWPAGGTVRFRECANYSTWRVCKACFLPKFGVDHEAISSPALCGASVSAHLLWRGFQRMGLSSCWQARARTSILLPAPYGSCALASSEYLPLPHFWINYSFWMNFGSVGTWSDMRLVFV